MSVTKSVDQRCITWMPTSTLWTIAYEKDEDEEWSPTRIPKQAIEFSIPANRQEEFLTEIMELWQAVKNGTISE